MVTLLPPGLFVGAFCRCGCSLPAGCASLAAAALHQQGGCGHLAREAWE